MKCCIWEISDRKFNKVTFAPEISNKGWHQENNASSLILSISCKAAVFNLICSHSKFTRLSLSTLYISTLSLSIVSIAP